MSKFREIFRGKSRYVTVRAENEVVEAKREVPDGLWTKCGACGAMLYHKDLERSLFVCDHCGHHFPIGGRTRLAQLVDHIEDFQEFDEDLLPTNPLDFPQYPEKLARGFEKAGNPDAIISGMGTIGGCPVVLAVMDFNFMGGSMGSVVGERVTRAFERAAARRLPVVVVSASGGARMQEGILSLMQMQKTVAAVEAFSREGLLYISVLTHPTTAGVFGSFASLGDINLAEPGATVGFAGQPVIEAATRKAVPPTLQKAETVFANGFIDRVISRAYLKDEISKLIHWHTATHIPQDDAASPEEASDDEKKDRGEDRVLGTHRNGQASAETIERGL